MFDTI